MSEHPEDSSLAEHLAALGELPLDERAPGYGELLAELQARLESADAAD